MGLSASYLSRCLPCGLSDNVASPTQDSLYRYIVCAQSPEHTPPVRSRDIMMYTDEKEQQMQCGSSYWDCSKDVERRRMENACMALDPPGSMWWHIYGALDILLYEQLYNQALIAATASRRTSRPCVLARGFPLTRPIRPRPRRRNYYPLDGRTLCPSRQALTFVFVLLLASSPASLTSIIATTFPAVRQPMDPAASA